MKDDWTRERVRRLVGLPIPVKPQTEMVMELTDISVSVGRLRVVLGPEPAQESEEEQGEGV